MSQDESQDIGDWPGYEKLVAWLAGAPMTMLPGLLTKVVELCVARKVFNPGELVNYVQQVENNAVLIRDGVPSIEASIQSAVELTLDEKLEWISQHYQNDLGAFFEDALKSQSAKPPCRKSG